LSSRASPPRSFRPSVPTPPPGRPAPPFATAACVKNEASRPSST
jgi:hypothetical protein